MKKDFNEIRSYTDNEVPKVMKNLSKEKMFINLIMQFVPSLTIRQIKEKLNSINTIFDFQTQILYPIIQSILKRSSSGMTFEGLENVEHDKPYLFISNHRDIILDPSLLNLILFENKYETSQVAIGNNLLIYSWIKDMLKLAKSFIVKRNSTFSQVYDQSALLSSYIRHMLIDKKSSVWISQREGRTKDGDDKTQVTVLKMLAMSFDKSLAEGFSDLNIIPVSISYEYEPCDILKAVEIQSKLTNRFFFKTPKDDLKSMLTGILGQKGHIHFSFGKPLKEELLSLDKIETKNEQLKHLATIIDEQIYKNYKLWTVNYIAYDVLNNSNTFTEHYTPDDKAAYINYIDRKLAKSKGDKNLLENFLIGMYANPVKNIIRNL